MIQHKFHQQNQKNHPQKSNGITVSASSGTNRKLEDGVEPSAFLRKTRPRCRCIQGTKSTGDHTGTKSCQKRRQVHYSDKGTIQSADHNTQKNTYQHCNNNRNP